MQPFCAVSTEVEKSLTLTFASLASVKDVSTWLDMTNMRLRLVI
jgi:hypothetical protein